MIEIERLLAGRAENERVREAAAGMTTSERHALLGELRAARTRLALAVGALDRMIAQLDHIAPDEGGVSTPVLYEKWKEVLKSGGEYPRPVQITTPTGYVEADALTPDEILFNHSAYAIYAWNQGMWRLVSVGYLHRLAEAFGLVWRRSSLETTDY